MSQFTNGPTKSAACAAAISQYARVALNSSGQWAAAGASTAADGILETESFAANDVRAAKLRTAAGTRFMIASEAISQGSPVYAAASGKIAADGSIFEGTAMEAATADGDIIEVLPGAGGSGSAGFLAAAQQTLAAGGGAVTVTEYYTAGASDAGGDAWTLANGTFPGQLKKIQLVTDGGGDAVLTPTSLTGGTTITFADAGDVALLLWDGDSWIPLELSNDADGATKPVIA